MTPTRLASAAGLTAAAFTAFGVAAPAAHAAPTATSHTEWNVNQTGVSKAATEGDVWVQSCLIVTANSLTVWRESSGSAKTGTVLGPGTVVNVIAGPEGSNRYKIDSPVNGWISADPRWTEPC